MLCNHMCIAETQPAVCCRRVVLKSNQVWLLIGVAFNACVIVILLAGAHRTLLEEV